MMGCLVKGSGVVDVWLVGSYKLEESQPMNCAFVPRIGLENQIQPTALFDRAAICHFMQWYIFIRDGTVCIPLNF